MPIEANVTGGDEIRALLDKLDEETFRKVVTAAAKRAATAARTAGTKQIRGIYTIKARDLKARSKISADGDGATLRVRGAMEGISQYSAKQRKRGLFVSVKRGNRAKVPRGFSLHGSFVMRKGRERFPLKGIYGPAVPQLFGNPDVMEGMQERGGEVFEARVIHEIGYRLGR